MYVFHSGAGVYGDSRFEDMAGIGDYVHLRAMLPPDLPNWGQGYEGLPSISSNTSGPL
jgi:hypothetical protein